MAMTSKPCLTRANTRASSSKSWLYGGEKSSFRIFGTSLIATEFPDAEKTTVVKLHGDIRRPDHCVLSKDQYDAAYGAGEIDLSLPIPKLLDYYFRNNSLLFLGWSLHNDRTIQIFKTIKASHHGDDLPQHFVIESCPESLEALKGRNAFLAGLSLTGIWFETKRYDCVESILRLALNELAFRDTQ